MILHRIKRDPGFSNWRRRLADSLDRPTLADLAAAAAVAGAPVDHDRIRRAVREILLAVGEDPDREGLRETPDRVARMYAELFSGLHADPRELHQEVRR